MEYLHVYLHAGREQSVLRRHQWIFSRAIKRKDKAISDGDVITVYDQAGSIVATGHYQESSLCVRILAFGHAVINREFWKKKLQAALEYRRSLGLIESAQTNAYRLVHGEGDTLPGLIIDIYDRVAVLQAHSIGMYRQRHEIAEELMGLGDLALRGVYDRSGEFSVSGDAMETPDRWLTGSAEEQVLIRENEIPFLIDVARGQKTGFFLDQRVNRQYVREIAHGKDVLNCFCYTGGFTLYAMSGGARSVTSVDSSATAMEMLEKNIQSISFTGQHQELCADVMTYLKETSDVYDLVICDPPAFAKSLHKRHQAVQAYKRLNAMAIQKVRKGGMLFTFSCSQVVDRKLFHDTVVAAAIEAGRPARLMYEMSQGPDHPVSVFHPEGSYLKGLALYIED